MNEAIKIAIEKGGYESIQAWRLSGANPDYTPLGLYKLHKWPLQVTQNSHGVLGFNYQEGRY